jgi:cell fate regulator YaaT (PSP1 superfamily)
VRQREAHRLCLARIRERALTHEARAGRYLFDGSKAIFYFCAEGRVDFPRARARPGAGLHTRIEMKQIGARDETKMLGGVGRAAASSAARRGSASSRRCRCGWRRSRACR